MAAYATSAMRENDVASDDPILDPALPHLPPKYQKEMDRIRAQHQQQLEAEEKASAKKKKREKKASPTEQEEDKKTQ